MPDDYVIKAVSDGLFTIEPCTECVEKRKG